jgi:hypothetical protein
MNKHPLITMGIIALVTTGAAFLLFWRTLYAKLPESNGVYTIELKAPAGAHIKTFKGTTTNGVIRVHWDLIDDRGNRYTNEAFDSVFQITLPGSGRSQTLKRP